MIHLADLLLFTSSPARTARHVATAVLAAGLSAALGTHVLEADQNGSAAAGKGAGLKIVVLAGEDAVNVIQQKTAVAPVVEVRDKNDSPVAGAVVRFAIRGGRASFGGTVRTISVTTDLAGKATAAGLTPMSSGVVQINVAASFQGQTAVATLSQINVATAAQAAAAAGAGTASGGAGAGAGGAGGGAGAGAGSAGAAGAGAGAGASAAGAAAAGTGAASGGVSAVTAAAVVGSAIGGGTLVAAQAVPDSSGPGSTSYTGPWSGQMVVTFVNRNPGPPQPCTVTLAYSGTFTFRISNDSTSAVNGILTGTFGRSQVAATCSNAQFGSESDSIPNVPLTGTLDAITVSHEDVFTFSGPNCPCDNKESTLITAALANGVITGSVKITYVENNQSRVGNGVVQIPLTLQ